MLPGKKYTPEDVLKILRKRFWLVVVPWAVIAAATAGIARKLPDMYRSTAVIQVVPPQVPENIVRSLNSVKFEDRLQATKQAILSRTRLESIIQEFNLYPEERKTGIMELVVEGMRRDIRVLPVSGDAFTVTYQGRNPSTVMKVTARLAGYFKDESMREGERRAEGTSSFVQAQVDEAKRKLVEIEQKRKQYMMSHAGELPTQLAANMQAVQTITMTLNNLANTLNADQAAKLMLERQIQAEEAQADVPAPPPVMSSDTATATGTAQQRLAAAKEQLAREQLAGKLPDHPTIKFLQSAIVVLTKEADAEALRAPVGSAAAASPADQARQTRLAQYRNDLVAVKKRIENNLADEKKLRAAAAGYQAKIDSVPTRETEMIELTREYDTLSKIYQTLVSQREASSASVNLERRQIGEQFNLLDQARLPERPFSPDRLLINLFGILGGLAVGLGLVALLEYRDGTFKADYEVAAVLGLPVLAVVPLMRSDAERRSNFRKQLFVNLGLSCAVVVCLAVLTYTFVR